MRINRGDVCVQTSLARQKGVESLAARDLCTNRQTDRLTYSSSLCGARLGSPQ